MILSFERREKNLKTAGLFQANRPRWPQWPRIGVLLKPTDGLKYFIQKCERQNQKLNKKSKKRTTDQCL